jgi:hypothetical protein
MNEIQRITRDSTIVGEFWGRVVIDGARFEYRAYLLPGGRIHVGTYYPR